MRAVICPVCNGKGVVYGIGESGTYPSTTCHGCKGKGWVEVGNADDILTGTSYPEGTNYGAFCGVRRMI